RRGAQLAHGALDLRLGDGADVAQLLGEHEVWGESAQAVAIEVVERAAGRQFLARAAVDLGARQIVAVQGAARDGGPLASGRRVVALVADRHDLVAQPKREGDLRGAREQGDDTHGYASTSSGTSSSSR